MVNNWLEDYKNFLYIKNVYLKEKEERFTYMVKLNYITDFKQIIETEKENFLNWLIKKKEYDVIKNNIINIFENINPASYVWFVCDGAIPEIEKSYIENFLDIIKIKKVDVYLLIRYLLYHVKEEEYIKLQEIMNNEFEYILENISSNQLCSFLSELERLHNTDINNKVKNNYLKIINKADVWECFEVLEKCRKIGILEENDLQQNFKVILRKAFENNKEIVEDENLLEALELLIKQFAQNQNVKLKDINYYLGEGSTSSCLKIGEYVLKVGKLRKTPKIPYHPRVLQPILRRTVPYTDNSTNIINFIEIVNYVDTNWTKGLTEKQIEEEMYKIFKEMRDDGIFVGDMRIENIGRLLKPNKVNYKENEEELKVDNESVGFTNISEKKKILPAGELVIIDSDYIYKEGESYLIPSTYSSYLERRYLEEKKKEDEKKRKNNSEEGR